MKKRVMWILSTVCALGILMISWVVSAQEGKPPAPVRAPQPTADVMIEHDVIIAAPPQAGMPAPPPMPPMQAVMARGGEEMTFAFISSEMSFDGKVVKGAPYSAEALTESTQVLTDGNRITRKSSTKIYRDSEGRTRRDQELGAVGPFAMMGDPPQTTLINDPVTGVNYMLDSRSRVARKHPFPPNFGLLPRVPMPPGAPGELPPPPQGEGPFTAPMRFSKEMSSPDGVIKRVEPVYPPVAKAAGVQGLVRVTFNVNEAGEVESAEAIEGHPLLQQAAVDAIKQWRFSPTVVSGAAVKVKGRMTFNFFLPREEGSSAAKTAMPPLASEWENESLGKQTIEGVEAEGIRSTMTIPVNAIGNERAIKVVTERWYSPELQTVVLVKRQDPRFGETVYRLSNITRAEPARELFEVPADYTIKDAPPMNFRVMKRVKE